MSEMMTHDGKFVDNMDLAYRQAFATLRTLYYERSQLYACLIKLMLDTNTTEFHVTRDEMFDVIKKYSAHFQPTLDEEDTVNGVDVWIVEHVNKDEDDEWEERP